MPHQVRWAVPTGEAAIDSLREVRMIYKVALYRSEEGYSVMVPGLPGCCSQGATGPRRGQTEFQV